MRRHHADPRDFDLVAALDAPENAEEDVVEFRAGTEEIPPLESAAGDEHEAG
jgi:hypothetical protein